MKVGKINEAGKFLTFKELVKLFSEVETEDDFNRACGEIDNSFQHEKISWNDHQLLYRLAKPISKAIGLDVYISY